MLKKLSSLFILIAASILCMYVRAEVISTAEAERTANAFMALDDHWHGATDATIRLVEHDGIPAYYVIEYSAGGWVVVSAQSSSSPVIGYNTDGKFAAPAPMELLLDFNAKIITARAKDINRVEHKGWKRIQERKPVREINTTPDVAPLIKINLNQSAPFNNYCPEIQGQKTIVGCVAVGMAQAIMVQRYPKAPNGQYSYHCNNVGSLGINYDNERPYDWDGMYSGNMDEIARLAYHCGVSVDMIYGVESSGTQTENVAAALSRNFGYDEESVRYVTKGNDIDAWLNIILGELVEGRAVVYRGQSGGGGHCWNVDGWKQSTQMVHCNWGWNGIGNGYFDINNMTDSYQGLEFLYSHAAVIGVGAPTTAPYDILLSDNQFAVGTLAGVALADVRVLCGDKNATYSYELYSEKSAGENTPSPYTIENGILSSTMPITNDNAFKHLYIKVTNTASGEWYEKEFKIHILSSNASDLEGVYTATAISYLDNYIDEEWQITITIDENDSNKVWFHPFCYFNALEASYINPIYAIYNAEEGVLTMPLGQTLFKRSGYHMVNIVSYDGAHIVNSGDVILPVSIDDKAKRILFDETCFYGVGDANNKYKWHKALNEVGLIQEKSALLDIQLSTTQFYTDAGVGTPLAEVTVINKDSEAVVAYELFGPKDENFNYTQSPYQVVDGKLISTEPISDSEKFRYLLIKATNTNTGEWIDKSFYINIIDLRPYMMAGEYKAFARSGFEDKPDEEWQVSITVDENDSNVLWISPICLFGNLTEKQINPVYADIDAVNNMILMPLGQVLYEEKDKCKFVTGSSVDAMKVYTIGVCRMRIYKKEDDIEVTFANSSLFGVGNDLTDEWWYQALCEVVFTNRDVFVVDGVFYNITNAAGKTVEVTSKVINNDQYPGIYGGDVSIPASITYNNETYKVTSVGVNAFNNSSYLTSIVMPGSIAEIEENAFANCSGLAQIECLATVPPTIYEHTFENVDKSIPVKVPAGCVEAYKNAPYWSEFTNINGDASVDVVVAGDGIEVKAMGGYVTVAGANGDAVVNIFSLSGVLLQRTTVANLPHMTLPRGVYLVQVDGTMHKVVI